MFKMAIDATPAVSMVCSVDNVHSMHTTLLHAVSHSTIF